MPSQNISLPVALEALQEEMLLLVEYEKEELLEKELGERQIRDLYEK